MKNWTSNHYNSNNKLREKNKTKQKKSALENSFRHEHFNLVH